MNIPQRNKQQPMQNPSFLFGGDDDDEVAVDPQKVEQFEELVSGQEEAFFREALSHLDSTTKSHLLQVLKEDGTADELSVSPSRWDCPIPNVGVMFPKQRQSLTPAVSSPGKITSLTLRSSEKGPRLDIIVPSLSVDPEELKKIQGATYYEERQLYSLLSLRDPDVNLIYISSMPLHPSIVNYYLALIPDADKPHERLKLFSTFDASDKPLTEKILERPRLLEKINRSIQKAKMPSRLLCFIPTPLEHKLATTLGVSIEASPDKVQFWGSKCGSRQIFRDCKIAHPTGSYESAWTAPEMAQQIADLWDERPQLSRVVVKLNEGFSGEGNALLDMRPIASRLYANYKFTPRAKRGTTPFTPEERLAAILEECNQLRFQAPSETWKTFEAKIHILGCIVEEFIEGQGKQSPSIQGIVHSDGSVDLISTHEQVLGGADDQVYLGCRFPCDEAYRLKLHEFGLQVAKSLSEKGARGRFGVDFIAAPQKPWDFENWDIYALEINLRQGGTTHPFETMHLLTQGEYGAETGKYTTPQGLEKFYIASDNLKEDSYKGLLPSDLMTIIGNHDLLFDNTTHTGVVFHLMGCLSQYGKVGATCIGNSFQEAEDMYEKIVTVLKEESTKKFDVAANE